MKKLYILLLAASLLFAACEKKAGFAIVIDPASYTEARAEVDAYAAAIQKADGYKVTVVEDIWGVPDSIRAVLKDMRFGRNPLVGAVFVGDIPVPMIRGAQHLASAFKMDESRYPREESSIPSDRYYDDFSLDFESLGHDEGTPLHYYRLTEKGSQRLAPDLFSGRIRPVDKDGNVRIEDLKKFLLKAADARLNPPTMDQMVFFGGHGYISESKTARLDEKRVWLEHFPLLDDGRHHIGYIDNSDLIPVKSHLMTELMRPDLKLAVLHHHGAPDTEYLNASARPYMVGDAKEYMRKNMREHLYRARQRGKDWQKAQRDMQQRFDVPASWFKDAFDENLHKADSLEDAALDLHLEDFEGYGYKPNARLVVLDACFNGSFQLEDCIADRYIFQDGATVAVQANSVNSLQDKWHDRFFGLVAAGGCAGDLARYAPYIESHIIGDPTFRFATEHKNMDLAILRDNVCEWQHLLKKGTPDQQALAVEHLFRRGKLNGKKLLDIYKTSGYATVRMEALYCLSRVKGEPFVKALECALGDGDEYIRRMAVKWAGKTGDPRLVPAVMDMFLTNNPSSRIVFNTNYALLGFPEDSVYAEFERRVGDIPMVNREKETEMLRASLKRNASRFKDDEAAIVNPDTPEKERKLCIRQTRNNLCIAAVPSLCEYLKTCGNDSVRIMLLEALGWQRLAWNADEIIAVAKDLAGDESLSEEVRKEAAKTVKRLSE